MPYTTIAQIQEMIDDCEADGLFEDSVIHLPVEDVTKELLNEFTSKTGYIFQAAYQPFNKEKQIAWVCRGKSNNS